MLLSKSAAYDNKKSRFIKNQEASRFLSNSELKTSFSKFPLLDGILFQRYKMKEIVNNFLLIGDKSMTEIASKTA